MITFTQGDLFECGIPAIAHGVNCRGAMGAGIAAQFRKRWPLMYAKYRRRCAKGEFEPGDVMSWQHPGGVVFNLATQDQSGADAHPWMIAAAVGRMVQEATGPHGLGISTIAMPMIGCGIGGLVLPDLLGALAPYQHAPVDLVIVRYQEKGIPG